jgi:hypothetical protein
VVKKKQKRLEVSLSAPCGRKGRMKKDIIMEEIKWLIQNSRGVTGLNSDGSIMPWSEVIEKYLPMIYEELKLN